MHKIFSFYLVLGFMTCTLYGQQTSRDLSTIYFQKIKEPNEQAYELLVPKGWQSKGGIYRINPMQGGGAGAIAAKNDFAVYNNATADVMIRWLPDNLFMDSRSMPAAQAFPPGSNYGGLTVLYKTDPVSFIRQVALPYSHPQASGLRVLTSKYLPELASAHKAFSKKLIPLLDLKYAAGMAHIEYWENGKEYEEILIVVLEDWGTMGAGLWGNKGSLLVRAPKGQLKEWAPVLETIHHSLQIDKNWFLKESQGQAYRAREYGKIQAEVQSLDKQIVEHQQKINAEIHNDMYLNLTGQEEYVNPYSGEIEVGTDQWNYRWQNEAGEIIYSNNEYYDPNVDVNLNVSGFKRAKIRVR